MGQVSEIFDGDAPHTPRGCPAQAWSVAEPLRAIIEDLGVSIVPNTTRPRRITIRSRKETKAPAISEAKTPKSRKRPQ
jgi:glycogen debranching enzyme